MTPAPALLREGRGGGQMAPQQQHTMSSYPRNERIQKVSHIGRCPVKGCKCVFRVVTERKLWTETHWNHSAGYSYPVTKSRELSNPFSAMVHCVAHRRMIGFAQVEGRYSENHKCDARCTSAIGPSCDCQCGGKNHGASHSLISI